MKDIMIDCETLSLRHDAMIVQVAAVGFDPETGHVAAPASYACEKWTIGLAANSGHMEPSTVAWWLQQNDQARNAVFGDRPLCDLAYMLKQLELLVRGARLEFGDIRLWSRGDMDRQWLEAAYRRADWSEMPWEFWHWRDQREYCRPWSKLITEKEPEGVKHDALSDCLTQSWWVWQVRKLTREFGAEL